MIIPNIKDSELATIIVVGTVSVIVVGAILKQQAAQAVDAIANINEDTPFEGFGVVGTAGNLTNQASGGILANIGSEIGLFGSRVFNLIKEGEFK